ncbi:MAG TPA: radical SAM/SPASM domain-containing protein [Gemmatimonadales bacterium]|nr:radical SAM/SPASM domain-containing protein [Gemmatimonadales bacterium]
MRAELARIAETLEPSAFPKKFAVELCADCNLRCSMCHHPQMRRPKGVMPMALWRRCADQIAEAAPDTDTWFSFCGEPLLEPELLVSMIRYGKGMGLRSVNVNTNGMLLTAGVSSDLLDSGVDLIVIGIDGLSRVAYEQARCGGDRDTVYANVEELLRQRAARGHGPEIQVQFIEMPFNSHELRPFCDYWLARGATVKARNQLSWGGKFDTPLTATNHERIPCPWAITMMHVFWDGRVPRCPGDTEGEEGVGNAWHEPLATLWGRLGGYRQLHLERRFDELPARCQTCTDWRTGAAQRIRPTSAQA